MTVVVPSILMAALLLSPDDPDLQGLLSQLPRELAGGNPSLALGKMMFNTILPAFFLMIPIMTASIMAGSSFVGEKERHTLETLLYCPITLRQIFRAKVLAAFFLSMAVSLGSFLVMCLVLETEAVLLLGSLLPPGANWLVTLFLLAPAVSLVAVTLIVRVSAKAKSVEESQQRAMFLVIPRCAADCGPILWSDAAERLDFAGAGRCLRSLGRSSVSQSLAPLYLRAGAGVTRGTSCP